MLWFFVSKPNEERGTNKQSFEVKADEDSTRKTVLLSVRVLPQTTDEDHV